MDHRIATPEQARLIWMLAWLSFVSGCVGVSQGHYDLSLVPFGVWTTSLLFWSNPVYGWRRRLDMFVVSSGVMYNYYRAYTASHMIPYYAITGCAVICYPIGHYYHAKGQTWKGCMWHGGIHILASLGNIVLYLGTV